MGKLQYSVLLQITDLHRRLMSGCIIPKEWTRDKVCYDRADIPKNERKFYTKPELALKIVEHAHKNRLDYIWVGVETGYRKGFGFCIAHAKMSEIFVVDVNFDFFVYTQDLAIR